MTNGRYNGDDGQDRPSGNESNARFGFFQCFLTVTWTQFLTQVHALLTHPHAQWAAIQTNERGERWHGGDRARILHAWKSTTHITLFHWRRDSIPAPPPHPPTHTHTHTHTLTHTASWTKSQLEFCGFRWSKQLRQNHGCLTPISPPKLCLCDRWSHPYLLWVVCWYRVGVMEHTPVHQLVWPLCSKYLSGGEPPPLIPL